MKSTQQVSSSGDGIFGTKPGQILIFNASYMSQSTTTTTGQSAKSASGTWPSSHNLNLVQLTDDRANFEKEAAAHKHGLGGSAGGIKINI